MKTIDSLTLSKSTIETFENLFDDCNKVAITFFGRNVAFVKKSGDKKIEQEITLPALCRRSKRQLQTDLSNGKVIKVMSGQHKTGKNKKRIVGYLVAA